ncbi:MAG: glycine betaine ABC transporter substrate-binding protein [Hyphomicrobiales bacterium]
MHSHKFLAFCCAATISAYSTVTIAADVVIGVPNWPSVQATAHILKVSIENELGLEVELKKGTNKTIFDAMDAGSIDVHPEAWLPNLDNLKRRYVDAKKTIKMNPNGATGTQAMCVSKATAERTGITELKELANPEMAKNFDSDGNGTGEVWIGAEGWGSTPIERIRARSYGYDTSMTLKALAETEALKEVSDAIEQDKNIVFFCYTPHHMFTEFDLVVLKEPAYDPTKWTIVQPSPTPGWLEKSSAGVAWDDASLHVSYATALETKQPKAAAMLSKVTLDTDTLSAMTYALAVEKQEPAAFAAKWVEENKAIVDSWFQ